MTLKACSQAYMSHNVKTRILLHSKHLDIYLVKYPEGHKVGPHVDMISSGKLYKLNMVLVKPEAGGKFHSEKTIFNLLNRFIVFRPDLYQHSVDKIRRGHRLLLSVALRF